MERLTEYTGEGQAIPRMDKKNNGHQKCMNRLAEYEDLEEQGKLLKPPCAVGDMTYNVNKSFGWIVDAVVKRIEIDMDGFWVITSAGTHSFDDFGKTVFLDKEEAGAALK